MKGSSIIFCLLALTWFLASCGPAPLRGHKSFEDETQTRSIPMQPVERSSEEKEKSKTGGLTRKHFSNSRLEMDLVQKKVFFQVEIKTEQGAETLKMSGELEADFSAELNEVNRSSGHRFKATALCIDTKCKEVSIDVYYKSQGEIRKIQFVGEAPQEDKVVVEAPPTEAPDSTEVHLEHAEEEFTLPGEYVGKRIEDRLFFEDLTDIRGEKEDRVRKESPKVEIKEDVVIEEQTPQEELQVEKPRPEEDLSEEKPDESGPKVFEKPEASPEEVKEPPKVIDEPEAKLNLDIPHPLPSPRPRIEIKHGHSLFGILLNISKEAGQAIGLPYTDKQKKQPGALVDASELERYGEAHEKLNPARENQFGTGMMVNLLRDISAYFKKHFYPDHKTFISGISKREGGVLHYWSNSEKKWKAHASHQSGQDADVAYLGNPNGFWNVVSGSRVVNQFSFEKNFAFLKAMVHTKLTLYDNTKGTEYKASVVSSIYVNRVIKKAFCQWAKEKDLKAKEDIEVLRRLRGISFHADHFHMRLRCSPDYPRCRNERELPVGSGCKDYGVSI